MNYDFFDFRQAEDESCDKFLKRFLDLISSLKLSGVDVTTHSHLKDMEFKKIIKEEPKKNTELIKKEAD